MISTLHDVEVPLQTNTPRLDPLPKRRGYAALYVVKEEPCNDGSGHRPRYVSLVPWRLHSAIVLQCSAETAVLATVANFVAYWRGFDPSATQSPSAISQPNHVIRPPQVSSLRELLQETRRKGYTAPSYCLRTCMGSAAELGLFVVLRDALRSLYTPWRSTPSTLCVVASEDESRAETHRLTPQMVTLRPSLRLLQHLVEPDVWCGFLAGGLAGGGCAALAHPYRVLATTAAAEPRFRSTTQVFVAGLREQPRMLRRGLRQGLAMSATGGALQGALQFGGYQMLREDGVYRHPVVFFSYCYAAVLAGSLCRYGCLSLRQHWHQQYMLQPVRPIASAASAGGGSAVVLSASPVQHPLYAQRKVSYRAVLSSLRRNGGITRLWDGFFASRPMLRAVPTALLLYWYDCRMRSTAERLHPQRRVAARETQRLTGMSQARPLPPYEFPTRSMHRRYA